MRIIPTVFHFQGNTLFDKQLLASLLAARVNQPTDLAGLQDAARQVRAFYQDRGYLLTDVYIPEQALPAGGGPVTLAVVEASIGRVTVRTSGKGASTAIVEAIARQSLTAGSPVTEYGLDKPVLLLRDLAGYDATATIEPGGRPGEANVILDVRAQGRQTDLSVGLDNHGARAAGQIRAFAALDVTNLSGSGDTLQARAQVAEISDTQLFRLSYSLPALGTSRLSFVATRAEYALGKQFAALGATGRADVLGTALMHPLIRSRSRNLYLSAGLETKKFDDETAVSAPTDRRIVSARASVLGNFADDVLGNAFTSFSASVTAGKVRLDAASLAVDQGPAGLHTDGRFSKLNLELQRAQFFANRFSAHASLQAQLASKNLPSAEKMSLGGPAGVRGYPTGEAVGDSGAILGMEVRYQLPPSATLGGEQVSLSAFYDVGSVKFNQDGTPAGPSRQSLDSVGIGLLAGRAGNYLLNASLAWRVGSPLPSGGEPDRSPRLWLTTQKWF